MKLTSENTNNTTKWRAPYIVHYIRDRERFRTQLRAVCHQRVIITAPTHRNLNQRRLTLVQGEDHRYRF